MGVGGAFPSVEGRVSLYTCIVYVFRMYLAQYTRDTSTTRIPT